MAVGQPPAEPTDEDMEPTVAVEGPEHGAAVLSKKPPPESAEGIRVRQLVLLSFWTVVIFLGLPIWWWTTSIYRARLPLQEMKDWANGRACRPTFPLQIVVDGPSLPEKEVQRIIRATQHALDDQNDFSLHHLRLRLGEYLPQSNSSQRVGYQESDGYDGGISLERAPLTEEALTVKLVPQNGLASARAELQPHSTLLSILYPPTLVPSASSTTFPLATFIASHLQVLFAEEQAIIAQALLETPTSINSQQIPANAEQISLASTIATISNKDRSSGYASAGIPDIAARLEARSARAMKYAPTYHLSISLFSPTSWPSSWDIDSAITEYLEPLIESASIISNFTTDTQIQLHASFSPSIQPPQYDATLNLWTLREEDLSGFINAAEWPLSPSIGAGPTLNFVIYIPDSSTSPLVVKESLATSWMVPQWGGVVILNPPFASALEGSPTSSLCKQDIQPALLVFSHQLLSFLGAPQSPPSIPLQLQTLTRVRAASLLLSAASTMGSLAQLVVALPSIAIPKTVSTAVDMTLEHLSGTCTALKDGRFASALDHAKTAETAAEQGFFEKSMVGQVYFPDEHKVAVYLPLLGPVGVPLVMSALKELRRMWTTRQAGI
ncbi:MAG: hypothetical protein Q9220_001623 [cf. Caloplaca sp. 1 TL-2023]